MSTINEQFLFDIIAGSEELTFSIFDRAKDYGSTNDLFFLYLTFKNFYLKKYSIK